MGVAAEICDEPTLNQLTCGTMNAPGNLALGLGSSSGSSSSDGVTTRVTPVTTATTLPTNSDKLEEQNVVEEKKRREKKKKDTWITEPLMFSHYKNIMFQSNTKAPQNEIAYYIEE